eukprot:scaffold100048_cov35-Prasinocladus_malaysianus.AAC.2
MTRMSSVKFNYFHCCIAPDGLVIVILYRKRRGESTELVCKIFCYGKQAHFIQEDAARLNWHNQLPRSENMEEPAGRS